LEQRTFGSYALKLGYPIRGKYCCGVQIVGSPQRLRLDAVRSRSCCVGALRLCQKGTGPCGWCFSVSADFSV